MIHKALTIFVLCLAISMTFARKLRSLTEPDNSGANGDFVLNEHDLANIEEGVMEGEFEYENVNEYEWIMDENGEEVLIESMVHLRLNYLTLF